MVMMTAMTWPEFAALTVVPTLLALVGLAVAFLGTDDRTRL